MDGGKNNEKSTWTISARFSGFNGRVMYVCLFHVCYNIFAQ